MQDELDDGGDLLVCDDCHHWSAYGRDTNGSVETKAAHYLRADLSAHNYWNGVRFTAAIIRIILVGSGLVPPSFNINLKRYE